MCVWKSCLIFKSINSRYVLKVIFWICALMVFKHTLCKILGIICNRYLNMRRVFKPFLEVIHTASFMKLTVLTVYETLIRSRVDILSKIPNIHFSIVFRTRRLLVSSRVLLKILWLLSEISECKTYILAYWLSGVNVVLLFVKLNR